MLRDRAERLTRYVNSILEKKPTVSLPSAREVLRTKGVEADIDVYAGSLKKAIRSHTLNGDVHLIMTRVGIGDWIARLFDGTNSVFKLFKRPSFSPVLESHRCIVRSLPPEIALLCGPNATLYTSSA